MSRSRSDSPSTNGITAYSRPPRLARLEQRHDVRVLQLGRDADLAQESLGADRGGDVGIEHLDGDLPLVAAVPREVDVRHAAAAELPLDDVAVAEGLLDVVEEIGHAGR